MNVWKILCALALSLVCVRATAAESPATNARPDYVLSPNDVVAVIVYQEEDRKSVV